MLILKKSFKSKKMKKTIIIREPAPINKTAMALVSRLFYGRIKELEEQNKFGVIFSKQLQLKKMEKEIKDFIKIKSNSIFEICILGKENDINDPLYSVKIRNYLRLEEDEEPRYYKLAISNNWGELKKYQDSADSITFIEIEKPKR